MNILVGNNHLANVGGTENYTYAIINELLRQGHNVEYFTFQKGIVSSKIEELGVPFMKREKYDLILANHNTVVAHLRRYGYTIQTCHGVFPELEQPSPYADAYVAISREVHDHLRDKGYDSTIIWNGIDTLRFQPKTKIHTQLHSVLSLCQSEETNRFVSECCAQIGVNFFKSNKYIDNVWNIEDLINEADLVVGIGRSLYDAIACGRCVISFDYRQYGSPCGDGYITCDNIEKFMEKNCSGRVSKTNFSKQSFIAEMLRYNPNDGIELRNFALKELNISKAVHTYLSLTRPLTLFLRCKKTATYYYDIFLTTKPYRIAKKTFCAICRTLHI